MRALVFRGPWDLEVQQRPDPEPGPGEVVVNLIATGICGSDLHGYTGESGRRSPGQVMGHETVGRRADDGSLVTIQPVIACGDCDSCAVGAGQRCRRRKVIGVAPEIDAAFADAIVVPERNLVPVPDNVPAEFGALVEPLSVGYHAVLRGQVGPSDDVLVIGGGPIGQACVLGALREGAERITVSEPQPERRRLLATLGIEAVPPDQLDSTRPGATVVLDAVGSSGSLADALARCQGGGRVVLVGMHQPQVEVAAYAVSTEERTLIGSFCYTEREFFDTAAWVGSGAPDLSGLIEGRVSLDDSPEVFRALAAGENQASKVLVTL